MNRIPLNRRCVLPRVRFDFRPPQQDVPMCESRAIATTFSRWVGNAIIKVRGLTDVPFPSPFLDD